MKTNPGVSPLLLLLLLLSVKKCIVYDCEGALASHVVAVILYPILIPPRSPSRTSPVLFSNSTCLWFSWILSNCSVSKKHLPSVANMFHISTKPTPLCLSAYPLSNNYTVPKKDTFCIENSLDISTKLVCSSSSLPSCQSKCISLSSLLAALANLAMLFILQLMHTASSVHQLKNKYHGQ